MRLLGLADALNGDPVKLWNELGKRAMRPYSRVTTWAQVATFWDWLSPGQNPYTEYRRRNRNLFKGAYEKRRVGVSYEEAKEKIAKIADEQTRRHAEHILGTGVRWCESVQEGDTVVGKGGKRRRIYSQAGHSPSFDKSYRTFLRRLKKHTGLKPHDLRALFATRLAESGAKAPDLMAVMGWASIKTAACYLQPRQENELADLVRRAAV
jgi:integrase